MSELGITPPDSSADWRVIEVLEGNKMRLRNHDTGETIIVPYDTKEWLGSYGGMKAQREE